MFIAHIARRRYLAPEERNVPLTKANISLLRSCKSSFGAWFYKHLVPPGLKTGTPKNSDSQVITPGLDNGVRDPTARRDGVEGRMIGESAYSCEKGVGLTSVCQRGHDLPGRVFHAICRIAGVDARDVKGGGTIMFTATRNQFLRPQERALEGVNVDDDIGDVREHLLFARQCVAVHALRATECERDQALSAGQQITLSGKQDLAGYGRTTRVVECALTVITGPKVGHRRIPQKTRRDY